MDGLKEIRLSTLLPNVAEWFSKIEKTSDGAIVLWKFKSDEEPKISNVTFRPCYYTNSNMRLEATVTRDNKEILQYFIIYRTSVNNYGLFGYDAVKRTIVNKWFASMVQINDFLTINYCDNKLF